MEMKIISSKIKISNHNGMIIKLWYIPIKEWAQSAKKWEQRKLFISWVIKINVTKMCVAHKTRTVQQTMSITSHRLQWKAARPIKIDLLVTWPSVNARRSTWCIHIVEETGIFDAWCTFLYPPDGVDANCDTVSSFVLTFFWRLSFINQLRFYYFIIHDLIAFCYSILNSWRS